MPNRKKTIRMFCYFTRCFIVLPADNKLNQMEQEIEVNGGVVQCPDAADPPNSMDHPFLYYFRIPDF